MTHLRINGDEIDVPTRGDEMLQEVLGQNGVSSSRLACGVGVCGACTVAVDGRTVAACIMPVCLAEGADIRTVESLDGNDPVVAAFDRHRAFQCGYCTPGAVMEARALLEGDPSPTPEKVREHLAGNLCRCGCYAKMQAAVLDAGARGTRGSGPDR